MTAPRVRRIDRGRNHWYQWVDGGKPDGVTWVKGQGVPKPALTNWAAKEAATFAADHLEQLNGLDDRDAIIDLVKGAPWRDRDKAARRGTEVHKLAEHLARGEDVDVPEELIGHVDSYIRFLEDYKPTVLLLETVVCNETHNYAGTLDSIMGIPVLGGTVQIDIKTNRSGPFGDDGLQLVGYERAEFYIDDDGDEHECWEIGGDEHEIAESFVLWVRADGYELIPFDTGDDTFHDFLYAQQVAHFVNDRSKAIRGEALPRPEKETA